MRAKIDQIVLIAGMVLMACESGCSSPGKSVGAGAALGGGLGATAGLLADPGEGGGHRIRNVLIGTGIGGALGAGAGLLIGNSVRDEKQNAFNEGKKSALDEENQHSAGSSKEQPRLVPAKTEARWVPDQVRGNVFVPAHFEYLIISQSHWEGGK